MPSGADDVPSVDNENVAGRTGIKDPPSYFDGNEITYVCADGFRTVPALTPIVATCIAAGMDPANPGVWSGPANADTVCKPGKNFIFFYCCISFLQSEHKTIMKTASIAEGFD